MKNIFLLVGLVFCSSELLTQYINFLDPVKISDYHTEEVSINFGDKPLNMDMPNNKTFAMGPGMKGIITIKKTPTSCRKEGKEKSIGFNVGIKDKKTNTFWLYSKETLYELDIERLLEICDLGDVIYFITENKKFKMPHHEILVMNGC